MGRRKMPDWMMDYVGAIGEDSYRDYRNLSANYYSEIADYHQNIYPERNSRHMRLNRDRGAYDPTKDLTNIDTKYKEKALDLACDKYGYKKPDPNVAKQEEQLTKLQENSPVFSKYIKESDKSLSTDDYIDKAAHKDYFKRNPEAEKNFKSQKELFRDIEEQEIQSYDNNKKDDITPKEPINDPHPKVDPPIEPRLDDE
ncbi:MAG: hypothetical protein BGO31_16890 [Bacteroidetes bacterium 43-16]|uniref:hypothetical protein n=1 Tax=uncultured Flavobacterium sp. TaxID=165435 RepID=UPI0009286B86|nr:hypothetical protein [uncultured Flavobacterium sp.]OJV55771.1 MAG: hypothetical protein BGO31_16890 [Bacteroidetes bacterium 43-16]